MPERERRAEKFQQAQISDSRIDHYAYQNLTGIYDDSDTCSALLCSVGSNKYSLFPLFLTLLPFRFNGCFGPEFTNLPLKGSLIQGMPSANLHAILPLGSGCLPVWPQTGPVGLPPFNKFSLKSCSKHCRMCIWLFLTNRTHGFRAFQTTWPSGTTIGQNNPLWAGSGSRSHNHHTRPSTHGQTNAKRSRHSLSR